MNREQTIYNLLNEIGDGLIVSSTGKMSRELFELRQKRGEPTNDFYMTGSMGCAVPIGLGIALNTKKQVYVLTGDGALLMKLGSLATVLEHKPDNLHIIVLNNNCHDSTGGQATAFLRVQDFVVRHCRVIDIEEGTRSDLGRPTISPQEIKNNFMGQCQK